MRGRTWAWLLAVALGACGPGGSTSVDAGAAPADGAAGAPEIAAPPSDAPATGGLARAADGAPLLAEIPLLGVPRFGDFDAMARRGVIRALVPLSRTAYFLDGAEQRGTAFEALRAFEQDLETKPGTAGVRIAILPVRRDELIPGLVEGYGDLVLGSLTITETRRERVDFSEPLLTGVDEIVVLGPASPALTSLDDLSGQTVPVRASSSYHASLLRLNERLRGAGLAPAELELVDERLEDEDLLEMVNAGLLPLAVVDRYQAEFWAQVFDDLVPRPDLALRTGGEIAWAFRRDSPELAAVVNDFIGRSRKGTLLGNVLFKRYLRDTKWAEASLDGDGRKRFDRAAPYFRKYAATYELPWLLLAAQAYQESRLDQAMRSRRGALGVMQLLPGTAADPNVGIVGIEEMGPNIHAGAKYLRFLMDRYFAEPGLRETERQLFALAAYNAGPARMAGVRRDAGAMGLDPDLWFGNVEVAMARGVGREPVQYVANIFKYWVAYQRVLRLEEAVGGDGARAGP